jgi:predicted nucleotidyltransferase
MARRTALSDIDPAVIRFAQRLSDEKGASHVLLFGSRARAVHDDDSDYDIIIVSEQFEGVDRFKREHGLKSMFYEEGGFAPMDLFCLTPDEFENAQNHITMIAQVVPDAIDLLAA